MGDTEGTGTVFVCVILHNNTQLNGGFVRLEVDMGNYPWSGKRTLEHCSLITQCVRAGIGKPHQANGKCDGYEKSANDDGPCEQCKKCELNTYYEQD